MNTTENPPPGDQGLAFQTHALHMILFGPFYVWTQTVTVRYEIVSLQSTFTMDLSSQKKTFTWIWEGIWTWTWHKQYTHCYNEA